MPHAPNRTRQSAKARPLRDPVVEFQAKMFALGYVTSDRNLLAAGWDLVQFSKMTTGPTPAMLMQGPPGTGKTFWAKTFAKYWDAQEFYSYQFAPGVTKEDLMFDLDIANIATAQSGRWQGEFTAKDAVLPGVFAKALLSSQTKRTILLLDELDKSSEKVDAFLLEYLQDCTMNAGPLGKITGNPHNLIVFTTMNNQRKITEPLMRRHFRVELDWPNPDTETRLVRMLALAQLRNSGTTTRVNVRQLSANIVRLANEVRGFSAQLKKAPSTPELAQAVVTCANLPQRDWGHRVQSWLLAYDVDRDVAKALWRKTPADISKELLRA